MSLFSIVLSVLLLLLVPYLVGNGFCELFGLEKSNSKLFTYGYFFIFAFCQIIMVPLILLKQSFMLVVVLISIFLIIFSIYGIIKNHFPFNFNHNKSEIFALILLFLLSFIFLFLQLQYQNIDEDDSRFIVNAVDTLKSNKVLLTNPINGDILPGFILDDSGKDVTSPWSVFIAYISKLTLNKAVVCAHSILPLSLTILTICIWWQFAEKIFGKSIIYQSMFTILMLLTYLFGYSYLWTTITMFMSRLWQGKSIVAATGIPMLFNCLFDSYENDKQYLPTVIIADLALCLFSGNGIVMGAIAIGCFALGYGIIKKDYKIFLRIAMIAVINAIYFAIEMLI